MTSLRRAFLGLCFVLSLAGLSRGQDLPRLEALNGAPRSGDCVALVVHGINPTPGELDALARDVASRGYRTFQFHYDDQQRLGRSADELAAALRGLLDQAWPARRVAVVAHSMGGLVARRALTEGHSGGIAARPERIRLFTIASPFGGFRSANMARLWPFGPGVHKDLGSRARFIRAPGALGPNVTHMKVETDEEGRTRRVDGRRQSDDKVPLRSQVQPTIDAGATCLHRLVIGHVASVLDERGRVPDVTRSLLDAWIGPPLRARPEPVRKGAAGALGALGDGRGR